MAWIRLRARLPGLATRREWRTSLKQRLVRWTPFGTVRSHAAVVRAIELARRGAGRIELAFGLAMLGRQQQARGDNIATLSGFGKRVN